MSRHPPLDGSAGGSTDRSGTGAGGRVIIVVPRAAEPVDEEPFPPLAYRVPLAVKYALVGAIVIMLLVMARPFVEAVLR